MASERFEETVARLAADVGRIASSLEALVHRSAVRDGAPRVVCLRPHPGADPLAPVNLARGPETLFIHLQLTGNEPSTVGPVTVITGEVRADALIRQGSARVERAQISGGEFFVAELVASDDVRAQLAARPQQPLELRVRLSPGVYSGGTVAVIPLEPAGEMASRLGWIPQDAYDMPESALRD